jgi:uncharacterized membrane protein YidH (DUF202 family)
MEPQTGRTSDDFISTHEAIMLSQSPTGHSGGGGPYVEGNELHAYPTHAEQDNPLAPRQQSNDRLARLKAFWRREISPLVESQSLRDHLANERTFLAWLRTSVMLSMIGIFTTQLFILQSTHLPHMNLSFFVLGVPLGSLCQAAALVNMAVGAYRFWRHQSAMAKGQACAGGWELLLIGGLITLVSASYVETTNDQTNFLGRSS